VYHVVCLFTFQLSLILIVPTHRDGQAELTWVAGYVPGWSPIQVLTGQRFVMAKFFKTFKPINLHCREQPKTYRNHKTLQVKLFTKKLVKPKTNPNKTQKPLGLNFSKNLFLLQPEMSKPMSGIARNTEIRPKML